MPRRLTLDKVIITAAVCGSQPTKSMNPAVPYSPQEIADAAIESWRAGAAIAHIHVRDPETGEPSFDLGYFNQVMDKIRSETDMLVNLTTSGLHLSGLDVIDQRLAPVDLGPELCSLDVGSVNFHDRVFINSPDWSERAAQHMLEQGVKPEIEVFEPGHIRQAIHLMEQDLIRHPAFFQLCMGVGWGIGAKIEDLIFMQRKLPPDIQWSVLGVGRAQPQVLLTGLELGGHIRVGFEDNLYLSRGVLAESNAQFVEFAVQMAKGVGREIATPAEARSILKI
jgi:3-keto-5-aminohexanoate cleavage enzyme